MPQQSPCPGKGDLLYRLQHSHTSSSFHMGRKVKKYSHPHTIGYQRCPSIADQGKSQPFCGEESQHHSHIDHGLKGDHQRNSQCQIGTKPISKGKSNLDPSESQNEEEEYNDHRTDQTQLLSNDRKDEIGVGSRKKEKFLSPFSHSQPKETSGTKGKEGLNNLETGPSGVFPRSDETHQPLITIPHVHQQSIGHGDGNQKGAHNIDHPGTTDKEKEKDHHREKEGCSKIGFLHHQSNDEARKENGGKKSERETPNLLLLLCQKVGEEDDQTQLGKF